jgi:uncharacterized membrane protein
MQAREQTYQRSAFSTTLNERLFLGVTLLCILIGVATPSALLVELMRDTGEIAAEYYDQLLLGATIFRVALVLVGISLAVVARTPLWHSDDSVRLPETAFTRVEVLSLAAICAIALILRLFMLNSGLWLDEILTYVQFGKSMPLGEIASTYTSENQHFLFSLAARTSILIFGDSAWSLRLPAALFGVASIWALYKLACEVTTRQEALLASLLMTFSYHHIWFSQNARGYTALLFWTLLSSYFFIRGLQKGTAREWLLYAASAALGAYTHTTIIFLILGHFLSYLFIVFSGRYRSPAQRWRPFFLGFCFAGLFTILLYSFAIPQYFGLLVEESTVSAWKNPLWTLLEFARGIQIGLGSSLLLLPALVVFGVGVVSYLRSRPIVVALLFLPVMICALLVVALGHHLWPRFFFFAMGFGVLVAVRGTWVLGATAASWLGLGASLQKWAGALVTALMIVASALSIPMAYGPKQDYEGALAYIESNREPQDVVAILGLATFAYRELYATDWQVIESAEELNALRSDNQETWVVATFLPELEAVYPDIVALLHQDFTEVRQFPGTVNHGTVHVLKTTAATGSQ